MKQNILKIIEKVKSGVMRVLSANMINKVISMLSTMVITRLLTPDEYGIWSYALNIYSYLLLASGFGLISGALQFATEYRGRGKAYSYYKYCVQKGLLINLGLITVVGAVIFIMELPIVGAKPYVISIFPILLLEFIFSIGLIVLRAQNRIKEFARVLNVNAVAIAIGTCCGAFSGTSGVVIARYIAIVVSILFEGSLLFGDIKVARTAERLRPTETKQLWHYSLFTGVSSAMNCLVYYIDITLIAALVKNPVDVSMYRVGTLIPNTLQFIPTSVITAILPAIIYHQKDLQWIKSKMKNLYIGLTAANMVICVGVYAAAPLVIKVLSGEQYLPAVPIMRILLLGYFASGTFRSLSVNVLAAFRHVHYGLFISVVSCVTDIVLNYFLILQHGMIGAAYATFGVDVITAALSFAYLSTLIRKGTINGIH